MFNEFINKIKRGEQSTDVPLSQVLSPAQVNALIAAYLAAHPPASTPAFPVNSIYLSIVNTNPSITLGYGTWVNTATGKMLVGYDAGDADFNAAEKTGGAKTHTHAGHANHVFTQAINHVFTQAVNHVFTQAVNHVFTQANAHSNHIFTQPSDHAATATGVNSGSAVKIGTAGASGAPNGHTHQTPVLSHSGGSVDAHSAHAGSGVDAHSGSGVDAHSGSGVDAHSGSGVDAHSAHDTPSNLNPYYTVYIWKRTA